MGSLALVRRLPRSTVDQIDKLNDLAERLQGVAENIFGLISEVPLRVEEEQQDLTEHMSAIIEHEGACDETSAMLDWLIRTGQKFVDQDMRPRQHVRLYVMEYFGTRRVSREVYDNFLQKLNSFIPMGAVNRRGSFYAIDINRSSALLEAQQPQQADEADRAGLPEIVDVSAVDIETPVTETTHTESEGGVSWLLSRANVLLARSGIVLTDKEERFLQATRDSIIHGDWFSFGDVDKTSLGEVTQSDKSAYSVFLKKLEEAGVVVSKGKERGGKRYRLLPLENEETSNEIVEATTKPVIVHEQTIVERKPHLQPAISSAGRQPERSHSGVRVDTRAIRERALQMQAGVFAAKLTGHVVELIKAAPDAVLPKNELTTILTATFADMGEEVDRAAVKKAIDNLIEDGKLHKAGTVAGHLLLSHVSGQHRKTAIRRVTSKVKREDTDVVTEETHHVARKLVSMLLAERQLERGVFRRDTNQVFAQDDEARQLQLVVRVLRERGVLTIGKRKPSGGSHRTHMLPFYRLSSRQVWQECSNDPVAFVKKYLDPHYSPDTEEQL